MPESLNNNGRCPECGYLQETGHSHGCSLSYKPEEQPTSSFEIMTDPAQRELLAERVDSLIERVIVEEADNLIFLDKTARPIVTLFLDLWHRKHKLIDPPMINFMNIGSETDEERVHGSEIERLRNEYAYLASAPDDSRVIIVDEWSQSGHTLEKAVNIIKRAFPSLRLVTDVLANAEGEVSGNAFSRIYNLFGSPPWRRAVTEVGYGITGVVDQPDNISTGQLTARSTVKLSKMEQFTAIDEKTKESQALKAEKLNEFIRTLETIPDDISKLIQMFVSIETFANLGIQEASFVRRVLQVFQNYIEKVLKPKLNDVKTASSQALPFAKTAREHNFSVLNMDTPEITHYKDTLEKLRLVPKSVVSNYDKKQYINETIVQPLLALFKDGTEIDKISRWVTEYIFELDLEVNNFLSDRLLEVNLLRAYERDMERNYDRKVEIRNVDIRQQINQLRSEMHEIAKEYWEKHNLD